MFKKILIVLFVFISLFAVVVAFQPEDFKITRSQQINAPPFVVFAKVNVLASWQEWSPWAKLDPNVKNTYEGPEFGEGAIFNWAGNNDVGEGRMTIVESRNNELVKIKLEFLKPFQTTNDTEFLFTTDGTVSTVTWSMSGKRSFMEKAFNLIFNMESILGADFEKGLAAMKTSAESEAVAH
jgi:hypothetical protein